MLWTPYSSVIKRLWCTQNLCFVQKYEKYQSFLAESFQFLEVKFPIYLNRCVFIMYTLQYDRSCRWPSIAPDKGRYEVNIFLISPQKHNNFAGISIEVPHQYIFVKN